MNVYITLYTSSGYQYSLRRVHLCRPVKHETVGSLLRLADVFCPSRHQIACVSLEHILESVSAALLDSYGPNGAFLLCCPPSPSPRAPHAPQHILLRCSTMQDNISRYISFQVESCAFSLPCSGRSRHAHKPTGFVQPPVSHRLRHSALTSTHHLLTNILTILVELAACDLTCMGASPVVHRIGARSRHPTKAIHPFLLQTSIAILCFRISTMC